MARKKKRWRDLDDPAEIFGAERSEQKEAPGMEPAYDTFRRHMEQHIQGETRAFHQLRSAAEHELQESTVVTSPPRRIASTPAGKPAVKEAPKAPPAAPTTGMRAQPRTTGTGKSSNFGTMAALGLIFAAIGFLLNQAWQQAQPLARKSGLSAKSRAVAEAGCTSDKEKPVTARKAKDGSPKAVAAAPAPEPVAAPLTAAPDKPDGSVPAEPSLQGVTLRAVELRKGPGNGFEIVDSLPSGFSLEGVLTTDRQWLRVKPGAFVSAEAVQFKDPSAAGYQSHWVGSHIANIREFPMIASRVLRKAEPGAELKLQVFSGEWAKVAEGGFVFRKLVTSEMPRSLQLPAVMRVTVEKAEIRGGPGASYPVLGLYFRNHKVEVQELQGGWLRIGTDQYIRAQELELATKNKPERTM